ncbi:hypothetical protein GCM10018793_01350 [Streptomyces sulfonofaciens]|uniref:Acyl carrier protein n=1 Tax=Streptomyces sulfonofaciens TaxID=68272 RepID=A0A919FPF0_9ACTN|nr:acyl carrier protein [Streptomyces sulfonofaciens]GHH69225.1 hypothetical protein GCM10018793_01350 [Streptomyces sulfonofaciens]
MHTRSTTARIAATVLFALATTAAGVLPATALTAEPTAASGTSATSAASAESAASASAGYHLALSTDPASPDFTDRTVDVGGVLTRDDGTPVADAPVSVGEGVLFETWNPWGDPIDPVERESRGLGTVRTDENGRFTLPDVTADRWDSTPSPFLTPLHEVEFWASYDPPEDPTDQDIVFGDTLVNTPSVSSGITYRVNRTKVRAGDTLTVTGKVIFPEGHGPVAGTRVLLRGNWENEYNAQTTADADGNFTVSLKVQDYYQDFAVFSAPNDYFISKAGQDLPVVNVTR